VQPEAEDSEPAPDLMAALEASLAEVRSGDSDEPAKGPKAAAKPRKRATPAGSDTPKSGAKRPSRAKTKS
jgi:hypothetical protein